MLAHRLRRWTNIVPTLGKRLVLARIYIYNNPDYCDAVFTGARGPAGESGEPGSPGRAGDKGDSGASGLPGTDGEPGERGADGASGKNRIYSHLGAVHRGI